MKKLFAWLGWIIAGIMVALRIFRRGAGQVQVKDVTATIGGHGADTSSVPSQASIESVQKKIRGGGALLLAAAIMAAPVPGRADPVVLTDDDRATIAAALSAAWEYRAFLDGKAIVSIDRATREGDRWTVAATVRVPMQDGGTRAVPLVFALTIRATDSGRPSWLAVAGIAAAAFAAGWIAGR